MTVQIAKLELTAGDTLVVSTDAWLHAEQVHKIKAAIQPFLPEGVKAMVLDRGMTVTKLVAPEYG